MLIEEIKEIITKIVKEQFRINPDPDDIKIDHPSLKIFGDYTTNYPIIITKKEKLQSKRSSIEIANIIANELKKKIDPYKIAKIETAQPGFINMVLADDVVLDALKKNNNQKIKEKEKKNEKKVIIEHTSPNTNKPLHIGHLRNASLGNAIVNIREYCGEKVIAGNVYNDRGIHIIKSMYGFLKYGKREDTQNKSEYYKIMLKKWFENKEWWHSPESKNQKPDHFIGDFYILGNNDYEESETRANQIGMSSSEDPHEQMRQMLVDWELEEPMIRALWKQCNDWFYQGIEQTLSKYNITTPNDTKRHFDKIWYESEIYKEGKDIIMQNLNKGVIKEHDDGHVEAILEKYSLPNVVILRKNKTALYITQDIELMRKRMQEDKADEVIILTSAEQNLHFQQLFAICEELQIAPQKKMTHIGYGTVRLPEGKMSSRKGTVITADMLFELVKEKATEKINTEEREYAESEKNQIAEQVAVAAIKYSMLKYKPQSNIIFDIEKSIAFEGDTGPYIQYTHARATAIKRKYRERYGDIETEPPKRAMTDSEREVAKLIYKFDEYMQKAAKANAPNYICEYLFNLAQKFNEMYAHESVINEKDVQVREQRYLICKKTAETLQKGLNVLGINAPTKM